MCLCISWKSYLLNSVLFSRAVGNKDSVLPIFQEEECLPCKWRFETLAFTRDHASVRYATISASKQFRHKIIWFYFIFYFFIDWVNVENIPCLRDAVRSGPRSELMSVDWRIKSLVITCEIFITNSWSTCTGTFFCVYG